MRHRDLGWFVPPNLSEMGADATELEAALARLQKYSDERREVGHKIQGHFQRLEAAKVADSRAYADAIKAGKKTAPEEKNVAKVEAEREALERRSRALNVLVEELRTETKALIEEHRGEWRRQAAGALERARERYRVAIEELVEARSSFYATWSALEWLEDPNRKYNPKGGEAPVTLNLDKSPGAVPRQQAQVEPVLRAMRHELGAPERSKAKENTVFLVDERDEEAG
jgi:hypothetical protein